MNLSELKKNCEPYRGVLRFVVVLLVAHFLWKFTVLGDECGDVVTFFGCDISAPFLAMSAHIAKVVAAVLGWLGYDLTLTNATMHFANGHGVHIVWGCSGLKQMFIFAWHFAGGARPVAAQVVVCADGYGGLLSHQYRAHYAALDGCSAPPRVVLPAARICAEIPLLWHHLPFLGLVGRAFQSRKRRGVKPIPQNYSRNPLILIRAVYAVGTLPAQQITRNFAIIS